MRFRLIIAVGALLVSCGVEDRTHSIKEAEINACTKKVYGFVEDRELKEISGIDASWLFPDSFYVHNDSGDKANLYRIDKEAKVVEKKRIKGADAVDWEDLSVGPCPFGSCVYIADLGNNGNYRDIFDLYMVAENSDRSKRYKFRYPDSQRYNAEAFSVNPKDGEMFVIRKTRSNANALYKFPPLSDSVMTLQKVCEFTKIGNQYVTGADIHHGGRSILIRTYDWVYEFRKWEGRTLCDTIVRKMKHHEPQGEAIAYKKNSNDFVTISEKRGQPLYKFSCP